MSCGGNIIARSLALVAIATGAAFLHWGLDPIASLASPKGIADPGSGSGKTAGPGQDAVVVPPAGEASDGDEAPESDSPQAADDPATGQTTAGGAAPAFDPTSLDTEITTEDAYQLWQSGAVVFIDARPPDEYEAGHIPAAYLVPPTSLDAGRLGDLIDPNMGGVDPSQRVVVYCEGGTCDASELVALHLQDMGFDKLHIFVDGFPAWQAAGYDVETGPDLVLGELP